ncbi:MAG: thioesterase family protein [Verrucomicrobiota bacterium]
MITSTSELEVRYSETDMMGVVYHGNYLPWLEMGRTQLLKEQGIPYTELEAQGLFLPVIDVSVKYRRPAKYDDRIAVITTIAEKPFVKIILTYEVKRGEELLATASTTHAFVNSDGQPVKAPKVFLDRFNSSF